MLPSWVSLLANGDVLPAPDQEFQETFTRVRALLQIGEVGAALYGLDMGIQQMQQYSSAQELELQARELFWKTVSGPSKPHATEAQISRGFEHAETLLQRKGDWKLRRDIADALATEGRSNEARAHWKLLLEDLDPLVSGRFVESMQLGTYADTMMKLAPWDQEQVRSAIDIFQRSEDISVSSGNKALADAMSSFRLAAQRQLHILSKLEKIDASTKVSPRFLEVKSIDAASTSFQTFFNEFAIPRLPVLLQNGTGMMFKKNSKPWNLNHIAKACKGKGVGLYKHVSGAQGAGVGVGQQVVREVAALDDWVHRVTAVAAMPANMQLEHEDSNLYLGDQSIANICPELLANFQVPHFFAQDYIHRAQSELLHHWPSLFLGVASTGTGLHKDAYDTNFWMAQLVGTKQWTFYSANSSDVLDAMSHWNEYGRRFDLEQESVHPLFPTLAPVKISSQPGDLIFIPQGTPHSVQNLDLSLAVSVNYIDLSNFWAARQHIMSESLKASELRTLASALDNLTFDWRMDREPTPAAYRSTGQQLKDQARRKRPKHRRSPTNSKYLPIGIDDPRFFRRHWPGTGTSLSHAEL